MKFRPIIFSGEMVKAILAGRKTQTRRIMKPQAKCTVPKDCATCNEWRLDGKTSNACPSTCVTTPEPPCSEGDILWVRETWCENKNPNSQNFGGYEYRADYGGAMCQDLITWSPSIHMPKQAARIFLRVKDVRVERLKDICDKYEYGPDHPVAKEGFKYTCDFIATWENTIKPSDRERHGWEANPWVWVIEFERCDRPEGWPDV